MSENTIGKLVSIGERNLGYDRYEYYKCVTCGDTFPALPFTDCLDGTRYYAPSCNSRELFGCPYCKVETAENNRKPFTTRLVCVTDRNGKTIDAFPVAEGFSRSDYCGDNAYLNELLDLVDHADTQYLAWSKKNKMQTAERWLVEGNIYLQTIADRFLPLSRI